MFRKLTISFSIEQGLSYTIRPSIYRWVIVTSKKANNHKCIGVIIDDTMSWVHHITYIKNKISKGIGIMSKAS